MASTPPDERDLWLRYHQHDPTALEALWERHEPSFRQHAKRLNRDDPDETDADLWDCKNKLGKSVIQDQYLPEKDGKPQPWKPWVMRVLSNLVRDRQRRDRRFTRRHQGISAELPDDYPSPEEQLALAELSQDIGYCEGGLEEPHKTAYSLRKQGMKLRDIAAQMGISITKVHQLKDEAYRKMAGCLECKGYEGGISHEA